MLFTWARQTCAIWAAINTCTPYPFFCAQDGCGSVQDKHHGEVAKPAQFLLFVPHHDAQGIHQHLGVHTTRQLALFLSNYWERTYGKEKI